MFAPEKVILIDDMPDQLFMLSTGFSAAGIPATSHWYNNASEIPINERLNPPLPEENISSIRLIVSDLNLSEQPKKTSLANTLTPILEILKSLFCEENGDPGPYGLIFWTQMSHNIQDIRSELTNRLHKLKISPPLYIDEIEKKDFLFFVEEGKSGTEAINEIIIEAQKRAPQLRDTIQDKMAQSSSLNIISHWEKRAALAASGSIKKIFETAKIDCGDDNKNIAASLGRIIRIATELSGKESTTDEPGRFFDAAMTGLMLDKFSNDKNLSEFNTTLQSCIEEASSKGKPSNPDKINASLNSSIHLDFNTEQTSATSRGSVIGLEDAIKARIINENFSKDSAKTEFFWDPEKIIFPKKAVPKPYQEKIIENISKITNRIAEDHKEILTDQILEELLKVAGTSTGEALTHYNAEQKADRKTSRDQLKEEFSEINKSVEYILLEAGAKCDHAQLKPRSIRFLLGAVAPEKLMENFVLGGQARKLKNGSIRILGPFIINDEIKYILVSLRKFTSINYPLAQEDIPVIFRARNDLVDFTLGNYASWSSRPGIFGDAAKGT